METHTLLDHDAGEPRRVGTPSVAKGDHDAGEPRRAGTPSVARGDHDTGEPRCAGTPSVQLASSREIPGLSVLEEELSSQAIPPVPWGKARQPQVT